MSHVATLLGWVTARTAPEKTPFVKLRARISIDTQP